MTADQLAQALQDVLDAYDRHIIGSERAAKAEARRALAKHRSQAPAEAHGDERAAFEAKFGKHQKWCDPEVVAQLDQPLCETLVGKYVFKDIQKAWEAWQTSAARFDVQPKGTQAELKAQALALCHALEEQPGSQYQTAAVLAAFKVYRAFESIEKHGEIRQWVFDVAAPSPAPVAGNERAAVLAAAKAVGLIDWISDDGLHFTFGDAEPMSDKLVELWRRAVAAPAVAHKEVETQAVAALRRLNAACDRRAGLLTPEAYNAAIGIDGMKEALYELDDARRAAKAIVNTSGGPARHPKQIAGVGCALCGRNEAGYYCTGACSEHQDAADSHVPVQGSQQ